MNDSIDKYINSSKKNLNTIIENLEKNIEYLDNELWENYDEYKSTLNSIIEVYYDNYYLYDKNDFSNINKYINFSNKINRKLKTILLAIIDYYEKENKAYIIREKEGSILFLTILIYLALIIYDKKTVDLDNAKKIEKVINNVIDNFQKIRFKKEKDLVMLISNIKDIVSYNEDFNNNIKLLERKDSHNLFININNKFNYFKVLYEYEINELNNYLDKDINIVNRVLNIEDVLTDISYDLAYYDVFKLLKNGFNYNLLFNISKKQLMNLDFINDIKSKNQILTNKIKFLIKYEDIINDYEFVNLMNEKNIEIYIDVNDALETNNYNMFMDNKNIIVPEEFLSMNDKYIEIWKDMGMNFIIKNLGERLTYNELINRK